MASPKGGKLSPKVTDKGATAGHFPLIRRVPRHLPPKGEGFPCAVGAAYMPPVAAIPANRPNGQTARASNARPYKQRVNLCQLPICTAEWGHPALRGNKKISTLSKRPPCYAGQALFWRKSQNFFRFDIAKPCIIWYYTKMNTYKCVQFRKRESL